MSTDNEQAPGRRRLSRDERLRQLLDVARQLIREDGTDALTLGRLAERAGVTKPLVYDHFGTRAGLLSMLYMESDARQTALMVAALQAAEMSLASRAEVIASAYVECVLSQGREIPGVSAALSGSPELELLKSEHESAFLLKCREALQPFAGGGGVTTAGLRAMLGAAEALSQAAAVGEIDPQEARNELSAAIVAMVERQARRG